MKNLTSYITIICLLLSTNTSLTAQEKWTGEHGEFHDGLAIIEEEDVIFSFKGYIDRDSIIIIPPIFCHATNFSDGLAKVSKDCAFGVGEYIINKKGKTVISNPKNYSLGDKFENGLLWICGKKGCGYMNKKGEIVIKPRYDGLEPIGKKYFIAESWCCFEILDRKGKSLHKNKEKENSNWIEHVSDDVFFESIDSKNSMLIDLSGKKIKKIKLPGYWKIKPFHKSLYIVYRYKKYGLLDKSLKEIIPLVFDTLTYNNKTIKGLIGADEFQFDKKGKFKHTYTDSLFTCQKYFSFYGKSLIGFKNKDDRLIIPYLFEDAKEFKEGYAAVKALNKGWNFIDDSGSYLSDQFVVIAKDFDQDAALVFMKETNKYEYHGFGIDDINLMDKKGNILLDEQYETISSLGHNLYSLEKDDGFKLYHVKRGFVSKSKEEYFWLGNGFHDGWLLFKVGDGANEFLSYIDTTGIFLQENFADAYRFKKGIAKIKRKGERDFNYINTEGEIIEDKEWAKTIYNAKEETQNQKTRNENSSIKTKTVFYNNRAIYMELDKNDEFLHGYIDRDSQLIVKPIYCYAENFNKGYAIVGSGCTDFGFSVKNYGLIDTLGAVVLKLKFDNIGQDLNGVFHISDTGKTYLFFPSKGQLLNEGSITELIHESEGIYAIQISESEIKLVDSSGYIFPESYDAESLSEGITFSNNRATIKKDGVEIMIDKKGNRIIEEFGVVSNNSGFKLQIPEYHNSPYELTIEVSPDRRYFLSYDPSENKLIIYNNLTGDILNSYQPSFSKSVTAELQFAFLSSFELVIHHSNKCYIYNFYSGDIEEIFFKSKEGNDLNPSGLTISDDGKFIGFAHSDYLQDHNFYNVYDIELKKYVYTVKTDNMILNASLSGSRYLIHHDIDLNVVYDLKRNKRIKRLQSRAGYDSPSPFVHNNSLIEIDYDNVSVTNILNGKTKTFDFKADQEDVSWIANKTGIHITDFKVNDIDVIGVQLDRNSNQLLMQSDEIWYTYNNESFYINIPTIKVIDLASLDVKTVRFEHSLDSLEHLKPLYLDTKSQNYYCYNSTNEQLAIFDLKNDQLIKRIGNTPLEEAKQVGNFLVWKPYDAKEWESISLERLQQENTYLTIGLEDTIYSVDGVFSCFVDSQNLQDFTAHEKSITNVNFTLHNSKTGRELIKEKGRQFKFNSGFLYYLETVKNQNLESLYDQIVRYNLKDQSSQIIHKFNLIEIENYEIDSQGKRICFVDDVDNTFGLYLLNSEKGNFEQRPLLIDSASVYTFSFSQNDILIYATFSTVNTSQIKRFDLESKSYLNSFSVNHQIWKILLYDSLNIVVSLSQKGLINFYSIDDLSPLDLKGYIHGTGFLFYQPSTNYYHGSQELVDKIKFSNGSLVQGHQSFDLEFNRPDTLLYNLKFADQGYRNVLEKAVRKRAPNQRVGIGYNNQIARILNKDISYYQTDTVFTLDYSIINKGKLDPMDVIIAINGVIVSKEKKEIKDQFAGSKKVVLQTGVNQIELYSKSFSGKISNLDEIEIFLTKEPPMRKLYFLGLATEDYKYVQKLDYAKDDILSAVSAIQRLDFYDQIEIDTFFNSNMTAEKIISIQDRLSGLGVNDCVMFYLSGHGITNIDDGEFYFIGPKAEQDNYIPFSIPFSFFEKLISNTPARNRLVFIDACQSGNIDKSTFTKLFSVKSESEKDEDVKKGFKRRKAVYDQNAFYLMEEIFSNYGASFGGSVISAASGTTDAYQNNLLKSGNFTYCLTKGLNENLADLNNDGEVYTSEMISYLTREVSKLSSTQKVSIRFKNIKNDIRIK